MAASLRRVLLPACLLSARAFVPGGIKQTPHVPVRPVVSYSRAVRGTARLSAAAVQAPPPPPTLEAYVSTLEHPSADASRIIEEWVRNISAPGVKSRRKDRDNLYMMRASLEAGAPVHMFALLSDDEAEAVQAIAMVAYRTFTDRSGQLAAEAKLQGLTFREGAAGVDVAEIVALARRPGTSPLASTTAQLIRRINNWAATRDYLVVLRLDGVLGRATTNNLEFEPIGDHEPYLVYSGSRWVRKDFQMIRLQCAGSLCREEEEEVESGAREAHGLRRPEQGNHHERVAGILAEWGMAAAAAMAHSQGDSQYKRTTVLAPAQANLEAMRSLLSEGAPVHVFALTTDGGYEGLQALAMAANPAFLEDRSGQLALTAREQGLALPPVSAAGVAVMEILAFVSKPAAQMERGVRAQLIRRISNWAATKSCLVSFNPEGPPGKTFSNQMAFEPMRGYEPRRVYTGSGFEYKKFQLLKLT